MENQFESNGYIKLISITAIIPSNCFKCFTDHSHGNDEVGSQLEVGPRFGSQIGILVDSAPVDQVGLGFAQRIRDGIDPEVQLEVAVNATGPFLESPASFGTVLIVPFHSSV